MGTFKRQERALWFILGALVGGMLVAAFLVLFEARFNPPITS
jgi:LPS O-antigen subunit length determinant protein (WzzB/FepE family)